MAGRIENWDELKALYVVHGKTHRQIAAMAGCSNSTISQKAKRDDWEGQRLAYKSSVAQRGYEMAAATVANQNDAVLSESIVVARAYLRVFASSIRDGTVRTNAKDALDFMKFLADQLGARGDGKDNGTRVIEGKATPVESQESLRRLVEIARTRVASPGSVGGVVVGEPEGTLPN